MRVPLDIVTVNGGVDYSISFRINKEFKIEFYRKYSDYYNSVFLYSVMSRIIQHPFVQKYKGYTINGVVVQNIQKEIDLLFNDYLYANDVFGLHVYNTWESINNGENVN